ncbi:MAG: hypothetical protein NTZ51_06395 [Proteobacteria bacterium]|nr:hypothetical protein [Pseudomonadota bacterium]
MSKRIHIIGPFNTGTNLLFNIINNSNCVDLTQNITLTIEHQHKPFNKHTLEIKTIETYLNNPDNLLIIMYKNIYNWLYSIKKEEYDIIYTKLFLPVELYGKKFPNMIELYNFYYINFMSILERYPNAIFLDYNKIIDYTTSYDYVNFKLSKINLFISSNEQFHKILMKPSKNHGEPVKNSIDAKQKYSSRQYVVKKFLINKPNFRRSIKNVLINYYETSQF